MNPPRDEVWGGKTPIGCARKFGRTDFSRSESVVAEFSFEPCELIQSNTSCWSPLTNVFGKMKVVTSLHREELYAKRIA
jgi:hypothetical protein